MLLFDGCHYEGPYGSLEKNADEQQLHSYECRFNTDLRVTRKVLLMSQVVRLKTDPIPFIENESFWSELRSDQKEDLLADGAKAEIDRVLSLFAEHKLDADETRELVFRLTKIAIRC